MRSQRPHQRFCRRHALAGASVGGSADVVAGAYEHTINMQSRKQNFQAFVLAAPRRRSA
jgi:hypothetical protein